MGVGQISKLGPPFSAPNIVRHPYNKDPTRDPTLENYPVSDNEGILRLGLGRWLKIGARLGTNALLRGLSDTTIDDINPALPILRKIP